MAKSQMTITGLEALQAAITETPKILRKHLAGAIRESTFAVADGMRRLAPHRTGELLSAITATVSSGSGLSGSVGFDSPRVFYWRFLEFGTVRMPPRPFIRPAAEAEAPRYIQRIQAIGPRLESDVAAAFKSRAPGVSGRSAGGGGLL
jgi:HK97 gp10 family phage protein